MKKIQIVVCLAFIIIVIVNILYYKSLYNKQLDYTRRLLDKQVHMAGATVDNANISFINDLNQVVYSESITRFFKDEIHRSETIGKMKMFFTKHEQMVTGIKFFDNNKNEFTLKKDETGRGWLEQQFVLHIQGEIINKERTVEGKRYSEFFLPVLKDDELTGNLVVTVDFLQYFTDLFAPLNLKDYQWQWILNDSGKVVYSTAGAESKFTEIRRIRKGLDAGSSESVLHHADIGGRSERVISAYYPARLLNNNFGLVISSPAGVFQKSILRNSLIHAIITLIVFFLAGFMLWKYLKYQKREIERLKGSEKMLFRMIEQMPVGIIIHNKNREIIKANKMAAVQYSYSDEAEMRGRIFPEISVTDENSYFLKNLGGTFRPDQFVILKKEVGEIVLFRSTMPVYFMGEEASLEMLIDVTMLETARKQEAKANVNKSEFLARMSYELRTPLNGIIGMADILKKRNLPKEEGEIVTLLQRSAGVLLNIIDDILDFSKIETGRMIIDEIPFNLREEIIYCYDLARTNVSEESVRLTCSVSDDIPDKLIGDPFRLRQILTNLMNHSVENTTDGVISLKCSLIDKKDRMLRLGFELCDTGKNFDNITLKKIFGDYINLESKVIQNDEESGFGTILARQLIGLMGGDFSAESPSGIDGNRGTRITFSVITYSDERPAKLLSLDNIRTFEDIKTLVITGSLSKDEDVVGTFHKLGLSLTVTTYQRSTVNQIKVNLNYPGQRYSLIIIIDDKEFDGFKVAGEIQENGLSDQFIILMMSTNDINGNYLRCLTLGIDHYIVKPFEIKELYDIIRASFPGIDAALPSNETDNVRTDIRILIVEDNKMNQKVIGTMLKSLGYSFDFADDGYSGYIQARTRRYDVIFMDLIMPEMDGFESAQKILEHDPTLLIAAFTADNMPDSKRKAELSGIRDFISKPVRIDDLRKFFTRHFNKNKKISSSLPGI